MSTKSRPVQSRILLFAATARTSHLCQQVAIDLGMPAIAIGVGEATAFELGKSGSDILVYEVSRLSDQRHLLEVANSGRDKVIFVYHNATSPAATLLALCRMGGSWRVCEADNRMLTHAFRAASGKDVRGRAKFPSIVSCVIASNPMHAQAVSLVVSAVVIAGFAREDNDRKWQAVPLLAASLGLSLSTLRRRCRERLAMTAVRLLNVAAAEWLVHLVIAGSTLRRAAAALRLSSESEASRLVHRVLGASCTEVVLRRRAAE